MFVLQNEYIMSAFSLEVVIIALIIIHKNNQDDTIN